jgi:hypothetical protein
MKKYLPLLCLFLAACQPLPISSSYMKADPKVYSQVKKDGFYLKNKLAIGEFTNDTDNTNYTIIYSEMRYAFQSSLTEAKLLSSDPGKAQYILSGKLKDVGRLKCFFGTCEAGSSIEYTLTEAKSKKIVYKELLVVPFNYDYPVFGANMHVVVIEAMGGVIGENTAHLIHVLTEKKKADLKGDL